MSVFLRQFINHKKYIIILLGTVFIIGFFFGFYQYSLTNQTVKDFLKNLFYLNTESYQNQYQLYVVQGSLYILICTYLSSSYYGHLGLLFLMFIKGMQVSFSLMYVFSIVPVSFLLILFLLMEIIIEIVLCFVLNTTCMHISIYVTIVTFYIEQNFNMKSMMNYRLNNLILTLICFSIALAFRVYIIPMF
ncbi:hypothetical protein [Candidatus Stoquefichus massiliensis]|uniref:hypothetical protein n=1 Tax=Candidatus Stoquefichus massiliensis TaxID=1470350 RepID=UPI0004886F9C|nr:hypothetical protein [Candidatus Stoquefichus massiliensis]